MIYGIRHHGPGSARALEEALDRDEPDALAIEMPADLAPALAHVDDAGLVPPVALVAYDPKHVEQALYYPLARFSPEWVALQWAATRGVPIHPIDLPARLMLALAGRRAGRIDLPDEASRPRARRLRADPLGELAAVAGYADRERWWERTFELQHGGAAVFPAVLEMIAALREAYPEATDAECRLREMHMARELLRITAEGAERVAVVCGAWHAPVLAEAERKKTARGYAAAKRGLKGPKLEVTWIPYTYERLRTGAGYGAGVRSPVWYGLLFDGPGRAPEHYLALLARELRERGHAASTAQIVDAAELLDAVTELRGLPLPGLEEVREAALGSLAEGSAPRLDGALEAVESLRTTGRVPPQLTSLPLQRDLEARLKATRLHKAYREMEPATRDLDLRKPAHLAASQLLCQLLLLGIPFGDKADAARGALGSFKEAWRLHWKPDFALRILAVHAYGQTIPDAAAAALRQRLDAEAGGGGGALAELTVAVDLVVLAGLFDEMPYLARRIRDEGAEAADVWKIAAALPALLRVARYPSLRIRESDTIEQLTAVLVPKLTAGLPQACGNVDDEAAYEGFRLLRVLQPYLALGPEAQATLALWHAAVERIAFARASHPLLAGWALRSLADAEIADAETTARWLGASLGTGVVLQRSALFVEGFLHSSALVLLHQPGIFGLFDAWLTRLGEDELRGLLPALRRTFAAFPVGERRKLSALVHRPPGGGEDLPEGAYALPDALATALSDWLA